MNIFSFLENFVMVSTPQTVIFILVLVALFFLMYKLKQNNVSSAKRIFIGTFLGLFLGLAIQIQSNFSNSPTEIKYVNEITKWYGVFGDGFIALIKMLIIPLVFVSIVNVIVNINANTNVKKLTKLTLITTLGMVALSSTVGFIVAFFGGLGSNSRLLENAESHMKDVKDVTVILKDLIPSNPINAMVELNIIAIVIFAMFIGVAARQLNIKDSSKVDIFISFIGQLHSIVSRLAVMIIKLMPYAVIPLLANTLAQRGLKSMKDVLLFILLLYVAVLIQFVMQSLLLLGNGISPLTYFSHALKPLVLAFSSRSSAGTLPLTIKTLTDKFNISESVANFVPSFSSTAGMQGCAGIYPTMLIVYIANANGIAVDFTLFMMTIIVVTLGSVGIAGVPGTAITAASVGVNGVGFGSFFSQINPILAVDPILDMGRTCLNVSGAMVNSLVVDKFLVKSEILVDPGNKAYLDK